MLMGDRFKEWNDQNTQALYQFRPAMTAENQKIFEKYIYQDGDILVMYSKRSPGKIADEILKLLPVEPEIPMKSAEDFKIALNDLFRFIDDGNTEISFYGNDGFDNQEKINGKDLMKKYIIDAFNESNVFSQFTTQRQVTFEEIKAEANRLFPIPKVLSCKPLNYLQEGKWLGFVKCGIWYREQIKTK